MQSARFDLEIQRRGLSLLSPIYIVVAQGAESRKKEFLNATRNPLQQMLLVFWAVHQAAKLFKDDKTISMT